MVEVILDAYGQVISAYSLKISSPSPVIVKCKVKWIEFDPNIEK